jgi:hypothetical protein
MSNFKIESILPNSTLEPRHIQLPPQPAINVGVPSMSLLTYDVEVLLGSVDAFLKGEDNRQLLVRTLKVLGSSLNDKKLAGGLERIVLEHEGERKRVYGLMIVWS